MTTKAPTKILEADIEGHNAQELLSKSGEARQLEG